MCLLNKEINYLVNFKHSKFENFKIWPSCNIYQFIIKTKDFKLVFVIKF